MSTNFIDLSISSSERKSIVDLAWNVPESVYRADPAISYSKLADFARRGPEALLDNSKKDTEALRFGSLVDTLMTEPETMSEKFVVSKYEKPSSTILDILTYIWASGPKNESNLSKIDKMTILSACNLIGYGTTWKDETRINNVIKAGEQYFHLLPLSEGKMLVHQDDLKDANLCVEVLKSHPFTESIFTDDLFSDEIEKHYQLKFKASCYSTSIRCMFDRIIVDHKQKIIKPYDLKTTGKKETTFEQSVLDWNYYIQANMYRCILALVIENDGYFKDFTIDPMRFVVINRYSRKPIVWKFGTDSNCYKAGSMEEPWPFSEELALKGYKPYPVLLKEVIWHLTEQKFDYPYDVYMSGGEANINLNKIL